MLKKVLTVYILAFVLCQIISGCCNCPDPMSFQVRWNSLSLKEGNYTEPSMGGVIGRYDTTGNFVDKNYVMYASVGIEYLALHPCKLQGFANYAYACKCAYSNTYNQENRIEGYRVLTVYDFDSTHTAGTDISEYFKGPQYTNGRYSGLTGTIELPSNPFHLQISQIKEYSIAFYLVKRPIAGSNQQFQLELRLANGATLTSTTRELKF